MADREVVKVYVNGQWVEGNKLDADEMRVFKTQYPTAFVVPSSEMFDLYERMAPFALALVQRGLKLWGGVFKGKHARGGEIGFSTIRPEHIDETEWKQSISTAGWTDLFGTSASPKANNKYSVIGIMGVANKVSTPIAEEIRFNIDSAFFSPESLEEMIFADNNNGKAIQPTAPYFIGEEINWHLRAFNNASSGNDKLVLKGLTVGKGSYLNAETIT